MLAPPSVTAETIITTLDGTSLTADNYGIDDAVLLISADSTNSSDFVLLSVDSTTGAVDGMAKKAGEDLVKADGDANNDDNEEEEDGALVGPPSYGNDSCVIFANDDNTEEDDAIIGVGPVEVALVAGTDATVSVFCSRAELGCARGATYCGEQHVETHELLFLY